MSMPSHLYKFRSFGRNVLQELCDGAIYFASPDSFNDPLDSKPSFEDDLDSRSKRNLFEKLYQAHYPHKDSGAKLAEMRYNATEYEDADRQATLDAFMARGIGDLILKELRVLGVFSMGERWDCPLMWSHYADQHAGICLEFLTHGHVADNLNQVRYDLARAIPLSAVHAWKVGQNSAARKQVLDTALLSKASSWSYEREWRIVAKRSEAYPTPLKLSAIYFGARCPHAVQTMLVKTLIGKEEGLAFYDVDFDSRGFELICSPVNIDEVVQTGVRPSAAFIFEREPVAELPPGATTVEPNDEQWGDPVLHG